MGEYTFGIYIPSYRRAETTTTYKLLEYYKYVVRESEYEAYKAKGIPVENIMAVPDDEIDDMIKVTNWIVDNSPEDVIAMIDDDVYNFIYRLDTSEKVTDPEICTSEIERIAQLMVDLEIGYASVDATEVPYGYVSEFEFKGTSGGMRWMNKKFYKARFDAEINYCCDLDVVLTELLKNRIILKPKYWCMHAGTDTNAGGNSTKTRASQIASVELMKKKWGKYFDYDFKTNRPYIRVPR